MGLIVSVPELLILLCSMKVNLFLFSISLHYILT